MGGKRWEARLPASGTGGRIPRQVVVPTPAEMRRSRPGNRHERAGMNAIERNTGRWDAVGAAAQVSGRILSAESAARLRPAAPSARASVPAAWVSVALHVAAGVLLVVEAILLPGRLPSVPPPPAVEVLFEPVNTSHDSAAVAPPTASDDGADDAVAPSVPGSKA